MNTFYNQKFQVFVAWLWLVFSLLELTDTFFDFFNILKNERLLKSVMNNPVSEYKNTIHFISPFINYLYYIVVIKFLLCVLAIIASYYAILRKYWAFKMLSALSWVMILSLIISILFAVNFNEALLADKQKMMINLQSVVTIIMIFSIPFIFSIFVLKNVKKCG